MSFTAFCTPLTSPFAAAVRCGSCWSSRLRAPAAGLSSSVAEINRVERALGHASERTVVVGRTNTKLGNRARAGAPARARARRHDAALGEPVGKPTGDRPRRDPRACALAEAGAH